MHCKIVTQVTRPNLSTITNRYYQSNDIADAVNWNR